MPPEPMQPAPWGGRSPIITAAIIIALAILVHGWTTRPARYAPAPRATGVPLMLDVRTGELLPPTLPE